MSGFAQVFHGGPVDAAEIARIRDVLMFEPPDLGKRLIRFGGLLVLASAIATYGLIGDSVATVIGAMIVAPLMLPIMGLAFSVSIADRKGILSSILVSIGGILTAIAVGFLLEMTASSSLDPLGNAQIMARTSPRLVDLAAALATGLAGAFAIGRRDISDTLPGVAIAISLVPPLTNAGILFAAGMPGLGLGSLLLFVTNYLAILITGTIVFGLMGYSGVSVAPKSMGARRLALVVIVVMVVVIAAPLAYQSYRVWQSVTAERRTAAAAETWLEQSSYMFRSATVREQTVEVVVTGNGDLPPQSTLQNLLEGRVFGMKVHVEALPTLSVEFDTASSGG